jgi:hypothetical protein
VAADYQITSQLHEARLDPTGRQAVEGWEVSFRDLQTGVNGEVFVDDDHYTAANVDTLIRHSLTEIRAVHALGGE